MMQALKRKRPPLTLPGIAVLVVALVVLVRSLAARNAHEIVLSLAALLFLAALFIAGKWTVRRLAGLEPVWNIPVPLRAVSGGGASGVASGAADWLVTPPPGIAIPVFFRLHFLVRGRFFPQGSASSCAVFAEGSAPKKSRRARPAGTAEADEDSARLSIAFPLGGLFCGETSCRLRDIFGFFSLPCNGVADGAADSGGREQTLKVHSAPCRAIPLRIDALSGAEDRRNKNANDEERYYMREYAPGDRLRDINWKTSDRIDTLITRISPDNQEKITRIEVHFRNYGPPSCGIADLWLLDRAKARLAWFLRKAKEEKDSYIFHIRSAEKNWDLNDGEDIAVFLEELTSISFYPPESAETALPAGGGEIYVFSTACDTSLPAFLAAQQSRPLSLFLAQHPMRSAMHPEPRSAGKETPETEDLLMRNFFGGGFLPLPRWLLPLVPGRRQRRQLTVNASRMMIDYAEIKI